MIKIGVLGTANIAEKRMIPAILKHSKIEYAGTAIASPKEYSFEFDEMKAEELWKLRKEKANGFRTQFGGECFFSFEELLNRSDIDAVYIPLPPALHEKWAKRALLSGKHILMEKPFTTSFEKTVELMALADEMGLAITENYGFCYHNQMIRIHQLIDDGLIGDIRLIRACFGFPHRGLNDFRYQRKMGGGALLDCGGYTLKAVSQFLKRDIVVCAARMSGRDDCDVDLFGSAMLMDKNGLTAQVSYGMDNAYKCELEIWGSKGIIQAPRIFTAPADYPAPIILQIGNEKKEYYEVDDQFLKIITEFVNCIKDESVRKIEASDISLQSRLIDELSSVSE